MNVPRLLISAASSGSGKTLITCGILQALMNRGMKVSSFKCGPDYIDPMFHSKVIGTVSRNVDAFFSDDDTLRSLFCDVAKDTDISVIEGVMGFYDGANVEDSSASSCDVSLKLGAPAILLIDSRGAARSVLATLKGFLEFEENLVKGVIFNRMSERTFVKLKDQVKAMGVIPLGYLPKVDLDLSSRHLGLVLPDEVEDLRGRLNALAKSMESSIDFDAMIDIARGADDLPYSGLNYPKVTDIKVGLAKDDAFCFIYEDNISMLRQMGADIIEFSPLRDPKVPDVDLLILPGGYPELHAKALEGNVSMRDSIRESIANGMPCLAECGGFMYLHDSMEDKDGVMRSMCGVISGTTWNTKGLRRFGYVTLTNGNTSVKGHEFHYWDSDSCGEDWVASKKNGQTYRCIHDDGRLMAGYPHLYYPSNPEFVKSIVARAEEYRSGKE